MLAISIFYLLEEGCRLWVQDLGCKFRALGVGARFMFPCGADSDPKPLNPKPLVNPKP